MLIEQRHVDDCGITGEPFYNALFLFGHGIIQKSHKTF